MSVELRDGDVVAQHPGDLVVYVVPSGTITRSRLRPNGEGGELSVDRVSDRELAVSGGLDGARYRIDVGPNFTFEIKVTTQGLVTGPITKASRDEITGRPTVPIEPIAKGQVIVKRVDGRMKAVSVK